MREIRSSGLLLELRLLGLASRALLPVDANHEVVINVWMEPLDSAAAKRWRCLQKFKDARSTQNFNIILLDIGDTQTDPRIYFEDLNTLGIEFRCQNRNSNFETELRCQKSESDKRDN